MFKQGFLQKNEVASADFAALKQIPKPMLAVRNASWNPTGWDAYNPSPLWVAETGSVEASSWTFREAINDHSDYTRTPHTVNVVDEVSRRIKDAPFRGGDQFPNIHPMECRSGGFVQVMETGDGGRSPAGFQTVNVWGPVSVTIGDEQKSTFTLRNQIRDFEFRTDINAAVPVHFLKWFDGTATHLLQFDAVKSVDGAYGISASAYDLVNDQPDKSKQSIDFNPPQRYTISSQRTMASQELWQCPLKSYGWVNHLRIFMTTMTEGSGPTNPDIVNVSFYEKEPSKGVRIIISRTSNGFASASKKFDQTFENLESISAVPYGFAKPYRDGKHGSGIILADGQHIVGSSKVNIRLRTIFIGTDEKLSIVPYEDPLTVEQANYSWSLLVCPKKALRS